jgi:hypothetical protein
LIIRIEPQMFSDDFSELSTCLDGLKTAVEIDCGPYIAVTKQPSNRFVIAGMMFQVDGWRGMPELVDGDPQSGRLLDPVCDLNAE